MQDMQTGGQHLDNIYEVVLGHVAGRRNDRQDYKV